MPSQNWFFFFYSFLFTTLLDDLSMDNSLFQCLILPVPALGSANFLKATIQEFFSECGRELWWQMSYWIEAFLVQVHLLSGCRILDCREKTTVMFGNTLEFANKEVLCDSRKLSNQALCSLLVSILVFCYFQEAFDTQATKWSLSFVRKKKRLSLS